MGSLIFVQVLYCVAQHRARHGCGVLVEDAQEPSVVLLSGLAQPASCGLVDQVLLVAEQDLGDPEGVGEVAWRMK
jgi:hypothetical protein